MKKIFYSVVIFLLLSFTLQAQYTIKGSVIDEKGEPLVGASIVVKGASVGKVTDIDGDYSFTVSSLDVPLYFSFVGYEPQEMTAQKAMNQIVTLKEGVTLSVCQVVSYGKYNYCGGCCCCCRVETEYINQLNPIEATPLSNGTIQLAYNIQTTWRGKERGKSGYYEEKKIHYTISKSLDNIHFKKIGESFSDTVFRLQERWDSTSVTWGVSHFWDKTINRSDSVYYEIEGYIFEEDEFDIDDEERAEPKQKEIVYKQKIAVAPAKLLTINNLYKPNSGENLELQIWSSRDSETHFRILDIAGRVVAQYKQALTKGNNSIFIENLNLLSGVYILSATQGEQFDSRKFTIVK